MTVTVSGSSSPLSGTGTGASTTSVPILNPSFSPTLIVDEFPTSFGTVPNTIGWSSGYENPVTLTSVPCAGQPSITVPPMMEPTPAPVEDVTITVYNTVVVEGDCGCQ